MKTRPCKKGCGYPAAKGRQFCYWHGLMRKSSDEQAAAAQARLAAHDGPHRKTVPKSEWPEGERWCAGCQSFIPLWLCSGSRCKACAGIAAHAGRLEKTYGITAAEYQAILDMQDGRCAICGTISRSRRLAVDHDHGEGSVRGLLCVSCNHDLLGAARDGTAILKAAIHYLENPPTSGRWDDSLRPTYGRPARRTPETPPEDPPF